MNWLRRTKDTQTVCFVCMILGLAACSLALFVAFLSWDLL